MQAAHRGKITRQVNRRVLYGGFTLIELLLVIAVVGILAAIAIPGYGAYREKLRIYDAKSDIRAIDVSIRTYFTDNGIHPNSLNDVGRGGMRDPWGRPYQYLNIADAGKNPPGARKDHFLVPINSDFDLYSMGPDGQSSPPLTAKISRDDIVRANDGHFIGLASEY